MPRNLAYERPALADTSFGKRTHNGKEVIVQRVAVMDLGLKQAGAPGKTIFNLSYLRKQLMGVRDMTIRKRLADFAETNPDAEKWQQFCQQFKLTRKDGSPGSRIIKVWVDAGETAEYKDLSKDGKGAWRKGAKHRGYYVVKYTMTGKSGKILEQYKARPVYAHSSLYQVRNEIISQPNAKIIGYFESGCSVEITNPLAHRKTPLEPGRYLLNSIWEQGSVVVTDNKSRISAPISLAKFIAAGLRRT